MLLVHTPGGLALASGGSIALTADESGFAVAALLAAIHPASLGDASFCADHGSPLSLRDRCDGERHRLSGSCRGNRRCGHAGVLRRAGLSIDRIETAIVRLKASLGDKPFGFNLIHSPGEQAHESATVDLFLRTMFGLSRRRRFLI